MENKVVSVTLVSGTWSGSSAPFTYTISNSNIISENTNVFMTVSSSLTTTQMQSLKKASIDAGVVSAGQVVLYAFGIKPSTDIPIILSIGGDF